MSDSVVADLSYFLRASSALTVVIRGNGSDLFDLISNMAHRNENEFARPTATTASKAASDADGSVICAHFLLG